jgi:hypothetical protein
LLHQILSTRRPIRLERTFDKSGPTKHFIVIETYRESSLSLEKALHRYGGSQGLLRCAAQSVANARSGDYGASSRESGDDEIRALRQFASESGLWMNLAVVKALFAAKPMRGGKEHRVAFLAAEERVIKDADVHALATESLYDYLTDLLLSNHYFDDDLQILGFYEEGGRLHLVSSQPYVDGIHPDWDELKAGLVEQGLRDPYPLSHGGNFLIDDDVLGEVNVFDLHVNNVIRDATGWLHPIDAHFYFDDRAARMEALQRLGLDQVSGATALATSGLSRSKNL